MGHPLSEPLKAKLDDYSSTASDHQFTFLDFLQPHRQYYMWVLARLGTMIFLRPPLA